ncbi:Possible hemagglutinin (DUF638) [uncultured Avibacterium sp.]|uniref:Possible hemagglutinin (DUF638) n=1 Tax=uncultured Avibacterium sp. TaxID=1936169 RepID=A0A486XF24_9PAST|nr:Possible hemagglutinin (DUF638) [uncultured Avibacterium sp.]
MFAEEGGYHVEANQVHLKGAAIASTNANNSELATNKLTAEHLQNHSSSQAMSGGLSYGFSHQEGHFEEKGTGKVVETPANNQTADNLRWVDEKNSSGFNPSMPMYESHHDSSVTKATITAGKITLNKDSQPVHTTVEALAKTLPISTALDNANPQVEKPKDTQGQLKEQKIVREAVSQLQSAASTYAANQAKAAQLEADRLQQEIAQEQSKPQAMQDKQKIAEKTTALATTLERQEKWSEKGEYKRNLDNLTTITGGILAGQSGAQIATTLASPTLNEKIKELTTNSKGEVNLLTNTLAHAMLGAVEAAAAKGNITAGALAASASELAAPAITKALGKDNPNQLSAEERQTVTALSTLAGSLASGLTAQQNGSATNTVSTLNAASLGGEIGKRAVENNYLSSIDVEHLIRELDKAQKEGRDTKPIIEKYQKISAENRQELLACKGNALCESGHLYQMNGGLEEVERNLGFFSRMTVPYPNDLNENNRITLSTLVEQENGKSFNQLSSGTKLGLSAIELGAAIGGTGLITKNSLGKLKLSKTNANSKLPVIGKTENYDKQTSTIHISSGAENVALYPKLKEQLMKENLINVGKTDPILQEITTKLGDKLNYGVSGTYSIAESNRLGKLWVGENPIEMTERGKVIGLMSHDGTRRYRFPTDKPRARLSATKFQSNFETYKIDPISKEGTRIGNAHLDVNKE